VKVRLREVRGAPIPSGAAPSEGTGLREAMGTGNVVGANIHGIEAALGAVSDMEAPGRADIQVPGTGIVVEAMVPAARAVVVMLDLGKPTMAPRMSAASTWVAWRILQP